jgi:DNA sulfur modification protein DndB
MENLIQAENAKNLYLVKKNPFVEEKISKTLLDVYLSKGYKLKKTLKNEAIVFKDKKHYIAFEDSIWCLFYEMGFSTLNSKSFTLPYDLNGERELTKQIDVFAMDKETILLVECKSAETQKSSNFKENLESYNGMKGGLIKSLKSQFPNKKIAFIYATNNYDIGDSDKDRLLSFQINYFDENKVKYFRELANHLGKASKFQLLGVLFPKTKIEGLESKVIAIKGQMGKKTYYSFSIQPEKLLKLAFVLHRSNSLQSEEMMPTYQRLIKKKRLYEIREFVNSGGFFPNSIIISVDSNENDLRFEPLAKNELMNETKVGILHLPQTYRSCYIIDGQHRLYGYSESQYENIDVIPVIAFVNLAKTEQVKMFMDINENQKSVSKTLRNTLDIDLLWDSPDKKDSLRALILGIIQSLGEENKNSPFFNRILLGENSKSPICNITLENLRIAFTRTNFFNEYDKNNNLSKQGFFQTSDNVLTKLIVLKVINRFFEKIIDNSDLKNVWDMGERSWLQTNNMIAALISLLDDEISIKNNEKTFILPIKYEKIVNVIDDFSVFVQSMLLELNDEDKKTIRTQKGGSAQSDVKKFLGYKINLEYKLFQPVWLPSYIENNQQKNYAEAKLKLDEFLVFLQDDVNKTLEIEFGKNWSIKELDSETMNSLILSKGLFEVSNPNKKLTHPLKVASYEDLYQIIVHKNFWSKLFKNKYQDEQKLLGTINPIEKLKTFYSKTGKSENLSKQDFENLISLVDVLYDKNK